MRHEGANAFETGVRAEGAKWRIPPLFATIVVAPTLLATIYYLVVAAPMYESVAQFVVRQKHETSAPAAGGMLQSFGLGGGEDASRAHEILEYMKSRDATVLLERSHDLRARLSRPEADLLSRFPRPFERPSFENLYDSFGRFVTVGQDPLTNISTLRVRAYRPEDARALADALLAGGEGLINRLNERSLTDTVGQATRQLEDAEAAAAKAQAALTVFRNRERLVDPDLNLKADAELMSALGTQLAALKAQRAGLAASAPQSPQLAILDRSIAAFEAQIEAEKARTAGQADSLAPKVGAYERLVLDQEIAGKSLAAAVSALEAARLEATRKQLYLERVVNPNLPDKAEQPRRLRIIFTVLVTTLVIYAALSLLVAGLREHRQRL